MSRPNGALVLSVLAAFLFGSLLMALVGVVAAIEAVTIQKLYSFDFVRETSILGFIVLDLPNHFFFASPVTAYVLARVVFAIGRGHFLAQLVAFALPPLYMLWSDYSANTDATLNASFIVFNSDQQALAWLVTILVLVLAFSQAKGGKHAA